MAACYSSYRLPLSLLPLFYFFLYFFVQTQHLNAFIVITGDFNHVSVTPQWGCPVLVLLSWVFHVLFWKVTLLSFQVTCSSSCVTGLMSPLISDCFHLCSLPSYIVCVFPCLVARVFHPACTSSPNHSHWSMPSIHLYSRFLCFLLEKSDFFFVVFFSSLVARFWSSLVFLLSECFLFLSIFL